MKSVRNTIVALLIGLSAPVLIWVAAFVALYHRQQTRLLRRSPVSARMTS
ncbi:MAG: hypothetical protein ABIH70_03040 [Chloroflexota bacterium]